MNIKKWRILLFLLGLFLISAVSIVVIKIAQGYRPDFSTKRLRPTGLLVATSVPDGAQVFIDSELKTATNATLNLPPGEYEVEIKKDGFFPWKKTLEVKKELVVKTDAYLFSNFPDLRALTFTGAKNPVLSPDGTRVVYGVASPSASLERQGLWVLDLTDRPLGLSRQPRQIVANAPQLDFSQAELRWSPDGKQILATFKIEIGKGKTAKTKIQNFLLDAEKTNFSSSLTDITPTVSLLFQSWEKEEQARFQAQISKIPEKLLNTFISNTANIQFSPDETKILYMATASASIPQGLIPLPPVVSTQKEEREIKPGRVYVYDFKEDKNFFIGEIFNPTPSSGSNFQRSSFRLQTAGYSWFPTSKHIFIVQKDKIIIKEYDGANETVVWSGPFVNSFAFPFPAGNRILILTTLGKDIPPNLYAVSLR
jgi:dipeptidyl aminopeptidase/acylaminoacyl peptidase